MKRTSAKFGTVVPNYAKIKTGAVQLWLVLGALFCSGVAGLINQVVWQRALKIFLGGSETLSSMVVVLVFMGGLGGGSLLMGNRAHGLRNPLRTFGVIELCLFIANLSVALVLSLDLSATVFAFQRFALSLGIPLRLIYAIAATIVLVMPCLMMGMTMAVAAETCQRQLGRSRKQLISVLFFLNTGGAVAGACGSGFYLMPHFGQRISLIVAASGNLLASLILFSMCVLWFRETMAVNETTENSGGMSWGRFWSKDNVMALFMGLLALGYEMYLFRVLALGHEPLPNTFAITLTLYLLFWSLGLYLSSFSRERIALCLFLCAITVAVQPFIYRFDRWTWHFTIASEGLLYFMPCIFFGLVYGFLVTRSAQRWGRDVGFFYTSNTIGSCLGILLFTILGYEMIHDFNTYIIALGLVGLLGYYLASVRIPQASNQRIGLRALTAVSTALILVLSAVGLSKPYTWHSNNFQAFWGRDGVIEVTKGKQIYLDGLWHASLGDGEDYIGTRDWLMAIIPLLATTQRELKEALVVGLGTGKTAHVLSLVEGLHVDAYEINHTIKKLIAAYPERTYNLYDKTNFRLIWRDARSGLALDEKKYDLITQAPLYLKQAGSSILLSKEYFELIKSRLNEGGIYSIYSNSFGNKEQALLVRQTAKSVFKHVASFLDGYLVVVSDSPLDLIEESWTTKLNQPGKIYADAAAYQRRKSKSNSSRKWTLWGLWDRDLLPWEGSAYLITDDHPLVEYPSIASALIDYPH